MGSDQPETGRRAFLGGPLAGVCGAAVASTGLRETNLPGSANSHAGHPDPSGPAIRPVAWDTRLVANRVQRRGSDPGQEVPAIVVTLTPWRRQGKTGACMPRAWPEAGFNSTLAFETSPTRARVAASAPDEYPAKHTRDDIRQFQSTT
ncbi:hypothetical protein FQR65_LT20660 [Abscondita terminalis]|nr:hypothetical protein FQR65_LT20660 [Abscondita terminalis]